MIFKFIGNTSPLPFPSGHVPESSIVPIFRTSAATFCRFCGLSAKIRGRMERAPFCWRDKGEERVKSRRFILIVVGNVTVTAEDKTFFSFREGIRLYCLIHFYWKLDPR